MPSSYSSRLRLELQADGENDSLWGQKVNTVIELLEEAMDGYLAKNVAGSSDVTLTATNGASDESRQRVIKFTGTLTGNISVIVPTAERVYLMINGTSGDYSLTVKTSSGTGVAIPQGGAAILICDGTNVVSFATISSVGLDLLDSADAGAARTAIGAAASSHTHSAVDVEGLGLLALASNVDDNDWDDDGDPLGIDHGGTGADTAADAFDALAPTTTRGDIIRRGASSNERLALGSAGQVLSSDGTDAKWDGSPETIGIEVIPAGVAVATGTGLKTFYMPFDFTVTEVGAGVVNRQTSGSVLTIDINDDGASILSTRITIDNNEFNSLSAATPPVISGASIAKGSKITIDVDQIGNGSAKGLFVWLSGKRA